jgi:hypothetical protein
MDVDARQVRAFRLAGQGLGAGPGAGGAAPADTLRGWAIQDSPPGAATAAALARTPEVPVGWLDAALYDERSVVALYNARTATAIVAAEEVAAFGAALAPADEAGLRAIVASALPEHRPGGYTEPVALAVEAIADALDGAALSRDDLHEQLRRRLPQDLLPWCKGCQSRHARRGLLVMASLRGRLCLAGRAGRQPVFARTDQWTAWDPPAREEAAAQLVRRYLTAYGPSTPKHFAEWAGLAPAHARELWALVEGELEEVAIQDAGVAWLLREDAGKLADPVRAAGVLLLGPGDPLLLGRDRETLVPDPARRKKLWTAINAPGVVIVEGDVAALWRACKQGKQLAVTVEAFAPVDRDAVQAAVDRLAPHRGATGAAVDWA